MILYLSSLEMYNSRHNEVSGRGNYSDSFLKAYKASETKGFFPYEWFDNPDKLDFPELPPYEAFFSKLRNNNPLDKDTIDYEKLRKK